MGGERGDRGTRLFKFPARELTYPYSTCYSHLVELNSMRQRPVRKCFACDRKLGTNPYHVTTEDGQIVKIGTECYKECKRSGGLWQPDKGGPRLRLLTRDEWAAHVKRMDERLVGGSL